MTSRPSSPSVPPTLSVPLLPPLALALPPPPFKPPTAAVVTRPTLPLAPRNQADNVCLDRYQCHRYHQVPLEIIKGKPSLLPPPPPPALTPAKLVGVTIDRRLAIMYFLLHASTDYNSLRGTERRSLKDALHFCTGTAATATFWVASCHLHQRRLL